MSSLVGGIGIIGQDIVCGFRNGKYKTFEGTEISIECVKAKVKDLVVEGKTIQDTEDLSNIESVAERENNILSVKINDNITTLNLPIPLRALPNGVADAIEGNKLVQRVGKVVFSGLEGTNYTWQMSSPYDETLVLYHVLIKEWGSKGNNNLKCITSDKFTTIINDDWKGNKIKNACFMNSQGKIHFLVSKEEFPTSTNFDNYLKNNPTTIYYELAEPIIHDLEIPQLNTSKGTNIITTSNNIKPKLSMKVKVKK